MSEMIRTIFMQLSTPCFTINIHPEARQARIRVSQDSHMTLHYPASTALSIFMHNHGVFQGTLVTVTRTDHHGVSNGHFLATARRKSKGGRIAWPS